MNDEPQEYKSVLGEDLVYVPELDCVVNAALLPEIRAYLDSEPDEVE